MKWLLRISLLAIVIGLAGAAWLYADMLRTIPLPTEKNIVIERGMGTREIARQLKSEQIIRSEYSFLLHSKLLSAGGTIKAGEYHFTPGVKGVDVITQMQRGEVVVHSITIPEGWTVREVIDALNAESQLTGEIDRLPMQGALLPETYHFFRGEERQAVLTRMERAMAEALDKAWQTRASDLPLNTKEEALVLASIVEKETGHSTERDMVAAVFINRLRKGMLLQADPTVIYAATKGEHKLERPIRKSDLARKDPFNTYVSEGLPPTPICNPGLAALNATLHPAATDALYFVADGSGNHRFTKSLRDHNNNVRKLRAIERKKK